MFFVVFVFFVIRVFRVFFIKSVRYRLLLLVFIKVYCFFEEKVIIFIELIFFYVIFFVSVYKEYFDEIFVC